MSATGERLARPVALIGMVALVLSADAPLTIRPSQYDFGKTAVPNGLAFGWLTVSSTVGDSLFLSVTGPDAGVFSFPSSTFCEDSNYNPVASCAVNGDFRPQSLGVKTATLVVTNRRGERATASLRGEGVKAGCEMKVVSCNYAHHYSGTFGWSSFLRSAGSESAERVDVDVTDGAAACQGVALDIVGKDTTKGPIVGRGLIAVEFEMDASQKLVYRITVACPTPNWPPKDGYPGTPSQPAELGQNEQKSYDNPATKGPGMNLLGSYSNPAPETDPLNGVTGQVSVGWELCNPAKIRMVVVGGTNRKKCS